MRKAGTGICLGCFVSAFCCIQIDKDELTQVFLFFIWKE